MPLARPISAGVELVAERTPTSKTYEHATNPAKRVWTGSRNVVHKPDDINRWLSGDRGGLSDCDLAVRLQSGKFAIDAWYTIDFDPQTARLHVTWLDGGEVSAQWVGRPDRGMTVESSRNSIFLRNVQPGLDLEYRFSAHGFEIFKIVKSKDAPHTVAWEYRWRKTSFEIGNNLDEELAFDSSSFRAELNVIKSPVVEVDGYQTCTLTEILTGKTVAIRRQPRSGWTRDAVYPIEIDATFTADISADADDGFSQSTTWNNSYAGGWYVGSTPAALAGLRWPNVTVDAGATIDSATLQWDVTFVSASRTYDIYGDNVDNAAGWSSSSRPDQITQTTATVAGTVTATGSKTETITDIVAEIIGRAGWASGNAIRFALIAGTGDYFKARDYASGSGDFATLTIEWTASGGGSTKRFLSLLGAGA